MTPSAHPAPASQTSRALARTEPGSPVVAVQVAGDVEAVPPTIAAAVYRVAQEGVTNARRHARNVTRVDVRVQVDDAGIRLDVHDDGEPATSVSPGFGITGMQERATPARRHLLGRSRRRGRLDRRRGHPANGVGDVTVRVLVADDQELVRTGLRMILNAQPDIEVVGEAADGAEAVALARRLRPDVCLFDIRMPVLDGLDATRELAGPGVADPIPVVVITTFDLDEYVYAALRAGARGFLLKDAGPTMLAEAVHAAARGDALIAPSVTVRLLETFAGSAAGHAGREPAEPLTEREQHVLAEVARGLGNTEIAAELHISLSTVKTHIASIMNKIGARNRVEVAIWALGRRGGDSSSRRLAE